MRLILLGPVGSGKGTQARLIKEEYNLPHISTGEIFRDNIKNETELGKIVKQYIDNGYQLCEEMCCLSDVKNKYKFDENGNIIGYEVKL